MAVLIVVGAVIFAAVVVGLIEQLPARRQVWWCKTHRCRDGECGVIGEHSVKRRYIRAKARNFPSQGKKGWWVCWPWSDDLGRRVGRPHIVNFIGGHQFADWHTPTKPHLWLRLPEKVEA